MKVVISSVVLAALLGFVNAKVELTNSNFDDIEAGSTFQITWTGAEGPVTLTLKNGKSGDLKTVQTITTNASGDSFVWPIDPSLPTGDYALEVDDGSDVNYSKMFPIDGTVAATSSTASSSSTVSVTSSSTASSSTTSSASTSTVSTSTASTSTVTTSSETSTSSSQSTSTASHSSTMTRTTSSTPTSTQSAPAQTSPPNTNDAHSMAAPLIPGILALLGAALF
ncbi:Ser-Thr-rich glycosyl-phosphatidyl-inositol-anchored membrane family-domain-containing protein [Xylaria castorea]|nr:Ser-Thr-rich glycosyl-phosphatidyl-inositol-anchored membrane family-domain-containing protein [Xylaria castorea]